MKYYCKQCNAEYRAGYSMTHIDYDLRACLFCGCSLISIPEWETPDQYQKRTGREWKGAVWVRPIDIQNRVEPLFWSIQRKYRKLERFYSLCAQSDTCPPDDWKGEE